METPLEKALSTVISLFRLYSNQEGDKFTLSKSELKELVMKELPLGEKMKGAGIDQLMRSLDKNKDEKIDFKEYIVFVSALCMAYNDFFQPEAK